MSCSVYRAHVCEARLIYGEVRHEGDRFVVRLPKGQAEQLSLKDGQLVEIQVLPADASTDLSEETTVIMDNCWQRYEGVYLSLASLAARETQGDVTVEISVPDLLASGPHVGDPARPSPRGGMIVADVTEINTGEVTTGHVANVTETKTGEVTTGHIDPPDSREREGVFRVDNDEDEPGFSTGISGTTRRS